MRSLARGTLERVQVESDDSEDTSDGGVALEDLSDEDLSDSEAEDAREPAEDDGTDSESDNQTDTERAVRKDLAEVPFDALIKARTSLAKPKASHKDAGSESRDFHDPKGSGKILPLKRKRENKHAPMEISSKRQVGRSREAVEVVKIERRDPRFDPDSASSVKKLNGSAQRNYSFLEDYQKDEMRLLKQSIAKEKDVTAREKMEKTLASMQSRQQAAKERQRRERVLTEFKHKERVAAKDGKIPYHLKAAEKNKLYLKDKFDSMKDSKNLDKFLEKKRKRRSQKDRKRALPM